MKNRIRAALAALAGHTVVYRATISGDNLRTIRLQGRKAFISETTIKPSGRGVPIAARDLTT